MSLQQRDQQVVWHPFTQALHASPPIPIVSGKDAVLTDEAGREYIDAISSWWVNLHGHANETIAAAVSRQLQKLEHVIFAGFTHAPAVELSERIVECLPGHLSKVFFSDDGSTSVEVALKMAFQYWYNKDQGRTGVIAFENAYHGDTFGAMSVGGRNAFNDPFSPFLFDVHAIPVPVPGREPQTLAALKEILANGNIAAMIVEPLVQGTAGMVMYSPGILDEMIRICRDHDVLVIADEVMTGFGRTGRLFASNYLEHCPDIYCLSKGLTGGTMALGLTVCTALVYEAFLSEDKLKTFFHGHSFTANPVACAASLASLELLLKPSTQENIRTIEQRHQHFKDQIKDHPLVRECRQLGTILAIEVNTPGTASYFDKIRDRLYDFYIEQGVLLRPLGNIVYIMPPYCITTVQLDKIYRVIVESLDMLGEKG